jgi:predicted nuclease of predicted toxin-antitoxin system
MRFLVDAQLPPALARFLTANHHGVEMSAEHVADVGLQAADDSAIWNYALQHQCIIVTKDEDFPQRQKQNPVAPTVVWLRIGNTSRRALLQWFEPLIPQIFAMVEQGNRLIEIR